MAVERADLERAAGRERLLGTFGALGGALAIALVLGSILIVLYGENPLTVYASILDASFGSTTGLGYVLASATPLIFSGLAVAVCFKAGLFNIGVEGQYLVGMVGAAFAALYLPPDLPGFLLVPAILIAAMLGGLLWAAIPALLKVKTGAHEVVTTIMLNGVAGSFVAWAINYPLRFVPPPGQNVDLRSRNFPTQGLVGDLGQYFGVSGGAHLSWLIFLALAAAAVTWFVLRRTRLGYEARAVGATPGSARAAGIRIDSTQVRLFLISGALAGLAGMQQILADKGYLPQNYIAQVGFTGISVAFLGQNNPIAIVFAAILWGILSRGETALQITSSVPREFIIILQSILILSVVITYLIARRRLAARELSRAAEVERDQEVVA
jgi:ABC-type uncharacterized transport system permease subunit